MHAISRPWVSAFGVAALMALFPISSSAQQSDPKALQQQLKELQKKIDDLSAEAKALQKTIEQSNPHQAETDANPAPEDSTTPAEDLMSVEPIQQTSPTTPPAAEVAGSAQSGTAPNDTPLAAEPINNPSNPGASKVFNPDISVIGDFLAHAGDNNRFQPRDTARLEEAELAFEAFVDPYAKAKFFLSATPEGLDVEEGFANFVALPKDFTAKVGKMKAFFGKDNTWHSHVRPWADQPLVIHNFFGDEGLADYGVSVSKIIPNPVVFLEATGEVFRGKVAGVFEPSNQNDLFYNAHLKAFKDLTENSNLEVGASYSRGTAALGDTRSGRHEFLGADFTYRWKPLIRGTRQSFIGRTEIIQNRLAGQSQKGWGFYSSGDYQFGQRWFTGLRIDRAAHGDDFSVADKGVAATLTFWPSEFSQLRGEIRRIEYPDHITANELLLQLQFAIGAHGAHTF